MKLWLFARRVGLNRRAETVVIFFTPTMDFCGGGIMSIAYLTTETRHLFPEMAVVSSLYPNLASDKIRNDLFPNEELLVPFADVCRITRPRRVILHIPEYSAGGFSSRFDAGQLDWLKGVDCLQVNILNQNIDQMLPQEAWQDLRELTPNITQTTAHDRYATQEICDRYGIPLHHFSTFCDHTAWPFVPFGRKRKTLVVSPDPHPRREEVLAAVRRELPDYEVVVVRDMTFMRYLQLISESFATLTFGEGFDGYFVQPLYCGSLGLAVYNETFFPSRDWLECPTVYPSYDELIARLSTDIRRLSADEASYEKIRRRQLEMSDRLFGREGFDDNLRRFYRGEYDYLPSGGRHVGEKGRT